MFCDIVFSMHCCSFTFVVLLGGGGWPFWPWNGGVETEGKERNKKNTIPFTFYPHNNSVIQFRVIEHD